MPSLGTILILAGLLAGECYHNKYKVYICVSCYLFTQFLLDTYVRIYVYVHLD